MNEREERQEAWTTALAEGGIPLGLVAGIIVYLGDGPGEVEAQTRVLYKALCRCGQMVTLDDEREGCRWRLQDACWVPGCDVEPVKVDGERGDMASLERAMTERHGSDRVERAKRARP